MNLKADMRGVATELSTTEKHSRTLRTMRKNLENLMKDMNVVIVCGLLLNVVRTHGFCRRLWLSVPGIRGAAVLPVCPSSFQSRRIFMKHCCRVVLLGHSADPLSRQSHLWIIFLIKIKTQYVWSGKIKVVTNTHTHIHSDNLKKALYKYRNNICTTDKMTFINMKCVCWAKA